MSVLEQLMQFDSSTFLRVDTAHIKLICYTYFLSAALAFSLLVSGISAPYGRYSRKGWGYAINAKLAWFVQEIPSFGVPMSYLLFSEAPKLHVLPNMLLLSLFMIHYFQRCLVYPFLIRGGKATTFVPFFFALLFCFVNGYLQTHSLLYHAEYGTRWFTRPHIYIGSLLFFIGMGINIHSDHVLRNLRKPGETGYKIPQGGMFAYISGANFFGEILEWIGFAIATWSLPGLAFAVFTVGNIGPRAYQHHNYYKEKFDDYPSERKAVIPFIL